MSALRTYLRLSRSHLGLPSMWAVPGLRLLVRASRADLLAALVATSVDDERARGCVVPVRARLAPVLVMLARFPVDDACEEGSAVPVRARLASVPVAVAASSVDDVRELGSVVAVHARLARVLLALALAPVVHVACGGSLVRVAASHLGARRRGIEAASVRATHQPQGVMRPRLFPARSVNWMAPSTTTTTAAGPTK